MPPAFRPQKTPAGGVRAQLLPVRMTLRTQERRDFTRRVRARAEKANSHAREICAHAMRGCAMPSITLRSDAMRSGSERRFTA